MSVLQSLAIPQLADALQPLCVVASRRKASSELQMLPLYCLRLQKAASDCKQLQCIIALFIFFSNFAYVGHAPQ